MSRFQLQLTVPLPEGWFVKESLTLVSLDGRANVIASGEPLDPGMSSQQYAEVQGNLLRQEFTHYRELAFAPRRIFGNRQGYIRRFEWTPQDGVPVTQIQIYYVEEGRGYTATATTPSSDLGRFEVQLNKLLDDLMIGTASGAGNDESMPRQAPPTVLPAEMLAPYDAVFRDSGGTYVEAETSANSVLTVNESTAAIPPTSTRLDLSSLKAVNTFIEGALEALTSTQLDSAHLIHWQQEICKSLNGPQGPDVSRLLRCLNAIDAQMESVGWNAMGVGMQAAQAGLLEQAEAHLILSQRISELRRDDRLLGNTLNGRGLVHKRRNNFVLAESMYQHAIAIADRTGDLGLKSGALDNLGHVYSATSRIDKALQAYLEARDAASRAGDSRGELYVLNSLGLTYWERGELELAANAFNEVIQRAPETHLLHEGELTSLTDAVTSAGLSLEGIALDNLASVRMEQDNLVEAERCRLRAIELFRESNQPYDEFLALVNLSSLYMRMGRIELAGTSYEQAADLIRDLRGGIDIDRYTLGRQKAIEELEREGTARVRQQLELARQDAPSEEEEGAQGDLTWFYIGRAMLLGQMALDAGSENLERHQYAEAERNLKQAVAHFRSVGADSEEAGAANDLGLLYIELGDPDKAQEWLLTGRHLAAKAGDLRREVNALANLSRLSSQYAKRNGLDSLDLLTQAELLDELWPVVIRWQMQQQGQSQAEEGQGVDAQVRPGGSGNGIIEAMLGNLHRDHGSYQRAESYYLRAIEVAERRWTQDNQQASTYRLLYRLINLHLLYQKLGDAEKSRLTLDRIRTVAAQSADPQARLGAMTVMGEFYQHTEGDLQRAYESFKQAIELSDVVREHVPSGDRRRDFISVIAPPYEAIILLAVQLGRHNDAFDLLERSKSRQMLETLGETRLASAAPLPASVLEQERGIFHRWVQATRAAASDVPDLPDDVFVQALWRSAEDVTQLRRELDDIWDVLKPLDPEYVALRRGSPLGFARVRRILAVS